MKRIIIPIILSLLSTIAVADAAKIKATRELHDTNLAKAIDLPTWDSNNYKDFTEKRIQYKNKEDCVEARDYFIDKLKGSLIIPGTDGRGIGGAYDANANKVIRVYCSWYGHNIGGAYNANPSNIVVVPTLFDKGFAYTLYYLTADKVSLQLINE